MKCINCKIDKDAVQGPVKRENYSDNCPCKHGGKCMCHGNCPCRYGGKCISRYCGSKDTINPVLSFIIYILILIVTFMIIKGICQSLVEVKEY